MNPEAVIIPGADEEGFQHITELRKACRGRSLRAFSETYPAPALLVVGLGATELQGVDEGAPTDSRPQLLTIAHKGLRVLRYVDRLAFLVKRPGNPFPHFVSLGRAGNNDIVLTVDSVSKVHGYFTCGADGWSFTDHGSTNGTSLNGRRLEGAARQPLSDTDQLQLGPGITLEFLLPETLHARLQEFA